MAAIGGAIGALVVLAFVYQGGRAGRLGLSGAEPLRGIDPSIFADAIARAEPAIVSIRAEFTRKERQDGPDPQARPMVGQGSGIIIDGDKGYITTNAHVVRNSDAIDVRLADGRVFPARLLGSDLVFDLAVLEIEGDDLPSAALGNSDDLAVGSWVIAIGNPLTLERSVTAGIISGKGRYVQSPQANIDLPDLLQTDAAINPGNSGGALVNLKGEVIGIPTAVVDATHAQGLGFAVPIDRAKKVFYDIIEYGRPRHPWLGVLYSNLPVSREAESVPAKEAGGALLLDIAEGSPAAKAGLKKGDIIVDIEGRPIENRDDLHMLSRNLEVGQRLTLEVRRNGRQLQIALKVGEMPPSPDLEQLFPSIKR